MGKRRTSGDGMVRKREDGHWKGRIVVGHKENGEPIFRYVLAKLHRDMDIYQDAELTEDSRMTLGEWLDRWMEEYGAVTLRPNTLRSYEQMDAFLAAVDKNEIWRDSFYTELTTGLRRGEICGLMWRDFDENAGTLKILRSVNVLKWGEMEIGETKTERGRRTIRLPPSTVQRLKERKKHAISQWIFPDPLAPEKPVRPSAAYYWMKVLLKEAGLPHIRFHDLRHTFATMALENGMDIKNLSAMLGHVSAATTLDIYTHIVLTDAAPGRVHGVEGAVLIVGGQDKDRLGIGPGLGSKILAHIDASLYGYVCTIIILRIWVWEYGNWLPEKKRQIGKFPLTLTLRQRIQYP